MTAVDTVTGEVLTEAEPTLAELEQTIEQGLESFLDVGNALLKIKAGRRYREAGFPTFEAYCMDRWNISRRHGNRLVVAAATVEALARDLSPIGDTETGPTGPTLPISERQVRPLSRLPEDERAEAWNEAVEQAESEDRPPTAADVERAVERRAPKTTVTERESFSRKTETEPVAPAEEPDPTPPPETAGQDAVDLAAERTARSDAAYRESFSAALVKAGVLLRLDPERCAEVTLVDDRVSDEEFIREARGWLDRFDKALHSSHLRSVR